MNIAVVKPGLNRIAGSLALLPAGRPEIAARARSAALRAGMGLLPPAHPPHLSGNRANYEQFCTDWFIPESGRAAVTPRE